ncbi:hypothetical protein SD311_001145 [Staphylococcus sp. KG4-3]|uniref:Uncharacterized protein n=1 Tax=Staphylococcus xylosus TaxID=1288 RepID=A0A418ING2_STAXY|nr:MULTISPECIES: hypothetical protein [Staphylococcus]MDW8543687.1 hypothetical protein [Staphylococcus sp. KG4-1]MDW8563122.1 hypothetical protein [Staphylococcus sp. KG4-3]PTI09166.1 hypothetical protein BU096_04990 [Staphylococcus xylosus]RIN10694.1 hypothetical protein BU097_07605 [Staphylococcus xylosus]
MQFKIITSIDDPFFKSAMNLYDAKFDIGLSEYEQIFKQSLKNEHTKDDYIFLVGIEADTVVSLATAHYEATTNSAFLIYLIANDQPNHDELITETLARIQKEINILSNQLHEHDVNFIMLEVEKEPEEISEEDIPILDNRRQFLYQHGFEKQYDINYLAPNFEGYSEGKPMDLFIKSNIELTKDIYGPSIKSNYILKYVFANRISRSIIYPLLEEMDLRKS